jgi:hypothetical protein
VIEARCEDRIGKQQATSNNFQRLQLLQLLRQIYCGSGSVSSMQPSVK